MTNILAAIIPALLALGCLIASLRHFQRKGTPWNNAWLYASEKERQHMDTVPYHRQSGVVFALLSALFAALTAETLLQTRWLYGIVALLIAATLIYAIASTIAMEKRKKQPRNP